MPQASAILPLLMSSMTAAAPVAAGTAGTAATGAALTGAAGAGAAGASALPALASTTAATVPTAMSTAVPVAAPSTLGAPIGTFSEIAHPLSLGWIPPAPTPPPTGFMSQVGNTASGFGHGLMASPNTAPPADSSSPLAFKAANWLRGTGQPPWEMVKQMAFMKMLGGGGQKGGGMPQITPIPVPPPMQIRFDSGGMGGDPIQQLMLALQNR